MIHFAHPHVLWLLLLLALAAAWRTRRVRPAALVYSDLELLEPIRPTIRRRLAWLPAALRFAALALLVIALARPQSGIGEVRTKARGVAMTFVLDRSWSMIQQISEDAEPATRIDAVKKLFKDFVIGNGDDLKGRPEDMIGLVTFARYADTVCPLTRSHDTLVQLVDSIELARPDGGEAGTAIGDGLALAVARLTRAEEELKRQNEGKIDPEFTIKSKVIVLMSDGSENMGEIQAPEAARLAADAGIKVYAIGIGGGVPSVIDTPFGRRRVGAQYPYDGRTLRAVAQISGGVYREANDADALRAVYAEIDRLEKTEIETQEFTSYDEAFARPATIGGALLLAEILLSTLVFRRSP